MAKTVFVDGDPSQGILGTRVLAAWLNAIQNHRHSGLDADGSAPIDYAEDTGAANAYAIALSPALGANVEGLPILFKASHTNTGASTLSINGMDPLPIKSRSGMDLSEGALRTGQIVAVVYNGSCYQSLIETAQIETIELDTTLHVATTGSDETGDGSELAPWATVKHAVDYLQDTWIPGNVTVTIELDDGTYTVTDDRIVVDHPNGARIQIKGKNTYSKVMSSVVSRTGETYTLQLNDVSQVEVGDFCIVRDASGGSYPQAILGFHRVETVDVPNNRISVIANGATTHPASGAVTASMTILKTRIIFNPVTDPTSAKLFSAVNGSTIGLIDKIGIDGNGRSGIYATDGSHINCGHNVGVRTLDFGFEAYGGGSITADYCAASFCQVGYYANAGGSITCNYAIAQGCYGAGDAGFWAKTGSIRCSNAIAVNCYYGFIARDGGSISPTYIGSGALTSRYGEYGYAAIHGGIIAADVGGIASHNNIASLYCTNNGTLIFPTGTVSNSSTGALASELGYIQAVGTTISSTTTPYSPAANTLGNENGYINT
jgi:hypothetical protein